MKEKKNSIVTSKKDNPERGEIESRERNTFETEKMICIGKGKKQMYEIYMSF